MDNRIYQAGVINPIGDHAPRRVPRGAGSISTPAGDSPTPINIYFGQGSVAPHVRTNRISYTVPSGRRATIAQIFMQIRRLNGAGPARDYGFDANIQRKNDSVKTAICECYSLSNATDGSGSSRVSEHNGVAIDLFEGDTITIDSIDNSVGGAVNYDASLIGTEYDATSAASRAKAANTGGSDTSSIGTGSAAPSPSAPPPNPNQLDTVSYDTNAAFGGARFG